ncbi:MAG: ATP-binding cassette domain-containing protein [Nitrospira sp.]
MKSEFGELLVRVDDLSLSFGRTSVLKGVSFEIFDTIGHGQVLAILGKSGVGKTQLFRCMAGLQVPTNGGVYIDGLSRTVLEGEVGVVAQHYPLINTRTVIGNLIRAHQVTGGNGGVKEAQRIAMEYLAHFGLQSIANHLPTEISGGQRQRVAIVQQMMCSRHYLIMDEPFSGLDIVAKDDACALIADMAALDELNTIVLTTHDVKTACAVADRVIVLGRDRDEKGEIVPGARVMCDYDLKMMDLCWHPDITKTSQFKQFVESVEDQIRAM